MRHANQPLLLGEQLRHRLPLRLPEPEQHRRLRLAPLRTAQLVSTDALSPGIDRGYADLAAASRFCAA